MIRVTIARVTREERALTRARKRAQRWQRLCEERDREVARLLAAVSGS